MAYQKETRPIDANQIRVFYIEKLVLNGYDISPAIIENKYPSVFKMLNFVNKHDTDTIYLLTS